MLESTSPEWTAEDTADFERDTDFNAEPVKGPRATRVLSDILFPYHGLEEAITIARAMHDLGGVRMTKDQIANALDAIAPVSTSVLAGRLSSALQFGLVIKQDKRYELTDLGSKIVSDDDAEVTRAKADAFQMPELYRKLLEHFRARAGKLPGKEGLENVVGSFGVSDKQKDRARQVFERSAVFSGFLNVARDRLSAPVIARQAPQPAVQPEVALPKPAADEKSDPANERLIRGMLDLLPPVGDQWRAEDRVRWLKRVSIVLGAIYDVDDDTEIRITIDKAS